MAGIAGFKRQVLPANPSAEFLRLWKGVSVRGSPAVSFARPFSWLQPEEYSESLPHIGEDLNRGRSSELYAPSVPVEILDVVGQDDACYFAIFRKSNFERITFRVTRDRARDRKARLRVVRAR